MLGAEVLKALIFVRGATQHLGASAISPACAGDLLDSAVAVVKVRMISAIRESTVCRRHWAVGRSSAQSGSKGHPCA